MGRQEELPKTKFFEEDVIIKLKELGIHNIEAMTLLDKWTAQEEAEVGKNPLDSIKFNQRRASVYLRAGFKDAALDCLEDAAIQATNESRMALKQEIIAEMEKIVASM